MLRGGCGVASGGDGVAAIAPSTKSQGSIQRPWISVSVAMGGPEQNCSVSSGFGVVGKGGRGARRRDSGLWVVVRRQNADLVGEQGIRWAV
jgi:hypothetical protein